MEWSMKNSIAGLLILALIIGGVFTWRMVQVPLKPVVIRGPVGGEKIGLLDDPEFSKIVAKQRIDYAKAGSMEMVHNIPAGSDFLWPSSQVALEAYKAQVGGMVSSEIIFNSPIVIYSWGIVADALIARKIVTVRDSICYISDMPGLIDMILRGTSWASLGLKQLYGNVSVISTDPNKSNSGAMFAGLLSSILCSGLPAGDSAFACSLPKVSAYFAALGYMEHSSADLFAQYLSTGVGAKPMIVGYESQIIEFSIQNKQQWPLVKNTIRILYPEPTVWSSHPLITLTPAAEKLHKALLDPKVQKLAWESHGFRTGMMGAQNNPALLSVVGIPANITQIIPMPNERTMDKILSAIAH
jgi:hypothetical protein